MRNIGSIKFVDAVDQKAISYCEIFLGVNDINFLEYTYNSVKSSIANIFRIKIDYKLVDGSAGELVVEDGTLPNWVTNRASVLVEIRSAIAWFFEGGEDGPVLFTHAIATLDADLDNTDSEISK